MNPVGAAKQVQPSCHLGARVHRLPVFLFLALSVLLAQGCDRRPQPSRSIVLGLDGMDPEIVDLLMSEGRMPNFARMRQGGAYGRLISSMPMLSPVLWTTIATGKPPAEHGIGHFVAAGGPNGGRLPVTSEMRRVASLWNILSNLDKKVAVVGWWATWPAETVHGAIVSDHTCYHFLFREGEGGAVDPTGVTYPPQLFDQIAPLIRRPGSLTLEEAAPYVDVGQHELEAPFDFSDDVSHFKWALATADSYRAIGLRLWQQERPDLLMVYIEGTDSVSHMFGHLFRAGELSGELADQQAKFGNTVEQMYLYADRLVGEYIDAMEDDTTLVVLSDHGFELGSTHADPSKTRDLRRVTEKFHRLEGILYLYGNGVRPHTRIDQPTQLDITPTLLALSGVAPAQDMPGRVLYEILDLEPLPASVPTYDTAGTSRTTIASDSRVDPQIMARLRSLGYIGGARSSEGERNLAAIHFEAGRYAEAAEAYEALIRDDPDDASLRTSLAGVLGALERYDDALEELAIAIEMEPLNVEAYHNRAVVFERLGRIEEAIAEYQTAARYDPQYEPSQRALMRLVGTADVRAPKSEGERRALGLAEQAGEAARRGAYQEAMDFLAEAQRVAPQYVLVYQYQSNVAYLMGDTAAAIRALEKALEIEPENALFVTNLQRLREQIQEQ